MVRTKQIDWGFLNVTRDVPSRHRLGTSQQFVNTRSGDLLYLSWSNLEFIVVRLGSTAVGVWVGVRVFRGRMRCYVVFDVMVRHLFSYR